jgi:hypothetical protein
MSLGDADHGDMHLFCHRLQARTSGLLDEPTAERLLSGQVDPDDAPPGYARVAGVLRAAASAPVEVGGSAELEALEAFAAGVSARGARSVEPHRRSVMPITSRRRKMAAVAAGLGLALTGGLSAAGALPGAAQAVAHDVLGTIGVTVPDPNSNAGDHPDTRGSSSPEASAVADTARTTTATGVDKGAEISAQASQGHSQAGTHGNASQAAGPPSSVPPAPTPNGPPAEIPPVPAPPVNTPPVPAPPAEIPPVPAPPVNTPPVPAPPVSLPDVPPTSLPNG